MFSRSPSSSVGSLAGNGRPAPPALSAGGFPFLPPPRRDRTAADYHLLRELGRGLCGKACNSVSGLVSRIWYSIPHDQSERSISRISPVRPASNP